MRLALALGVGGGIPALEEVVVQRLMGLVSLAVAGAARELPGRKTYRWLVFSPRESPATRTMQKARGAVPANNPPVYGDADTNRAASAGADRPHRRLRNRGKGQAPYPAGRDLLPLCGASGADSGRFRGGSVPQG